MSTHIGICPTCGGAVGKVEGRLGDHQRYADGAGFGPGQPHDLVPCEGDQHE